MRKLIVFFSLLLLTSCGYHAGQGNLTENYATISIPYIKGDEYGIFTALLAKEIADSGPLRYQQCNGHLTLLVSVLDYDYDNIGFRYDTKNSKEHPNKLIHSVIPVETRVEAVAEVSVIESASGEVLLGPAKIRAHLDFDHDYIYSKDNINEKSLGQLTDYDVAVDDSFRPLYERLAHKIADYIYDAW